MKKQLVGVMLLVAALVLPAGSAQAQAARQNGASGSAASPGAGGTTRGARAGGAQEKRMDRVFYTRASEGGQVEVTLGKLAQEKGSSQEVKDFGKRMVDDHTKANTQLQDIAKQKQIQLATTLRPVDQRHLEHLRTLSGNDFDRAYMEMMVRDHRETIRLFEHEANRGSDQEAKTYATSTLPTLRDHLKMAEQVLTKLPKSTGGGTKGMQGGTHGQTGSSTGGTSSGGSTSSGAR